MSCGQAKAGVANQGFRNVSTVECSGGTYTFREIRKGPAWVYLCELKNWRGLAPLTRSPELSGTT